MLNRSKIRINEGYSHTNDWYTFTRVKKSTEISDEQEARCVSSEALNLEHFIAASDASSGVGFQTYFCGAGIYFEC